MKKIVFILLSFGLAQEMEVDGNLKVTGTVDASGNPITNVGAPQTMSDAINAGILQSALSDENKYEFKWYRVNIYNNIDDTGIGYGSKWWEIDVTHISSPGYNFIDELHVRIAENWVVHYWQGGSCVLKRKVSDE